MGDGNFMLLGQVGEDMSVYTTPARDTAFLTRWLPLVMTDFEDVYATMSASLLRELYPDLYRDGPNRARVEANCALILGMVRERTKLDARETRRQALGAFIAEFASLYGVVENFYVGNDTAPGVSIWRDRFWAADGFRRFASPLQAEERAEVLRPSFVEQLPICRSFFLIPENNYGVTPKTFFLTALGNYYRYTLLLEGDHYATHHRGFLQKHIAFAERWGLADCAEAFLFADNAD